MAGRGVGLARRPGRRPAGRRELRRRRPARPRRAGPAAGRRTRPRTLLLVSHVTPIKTLACRALLAPPAALFRIHLDVASLCEIDWFADGPAVVRSLNDTAHLRQAGR